jgi:hypothetical protein
MNIEHVLDVIDRPTAWAWICKTHLGNIVKCPICGALITGARALASFESCKRTYCATHGEVFQARAAVAQLRGTEWTPEGYVKFRLLHLSELPPATIGRILGKSTACVRDMIDRCAELDPLCPNWPQPLAGGLLTDKG